MTDADGPQTSILALTPANRAFARSFVTSRTARGTVNSLRLSVPGSGLLPTKQQYSSDIPLGSLK
jgi:hypothetical protein